MTLKTFMYRIFFKWTLYLSAQFSTTRPSRASKETEILLVRYLGIYGPGTWEIFIKEIVENG